MYGEKTVLLEAYNELELSLLSNGIIISFIKQGPNNPQQNYPKTESKNKLQIAFFSDFMNITF